MQWRRTDVFKQRFRSRPMVIAVLVAALCLLLDLRGASEAVYAQGVQPALQAHNDPQLGMILTDPHGRTLYVFTQDEAEKSNCTGSCAENWPPLLMTGNPSAQAELPAALGVSIRQDGARQVTYHGRPLYYSRHDRTPGDTNGHGVDALWYVANVLPTVQIRAHPELGDILVGPDGMTLYTFANDEENSYRCSDGCAENWLPLVVSYQAEAPPGLRGRLSTLERSDDDRGIRLQVSYKGRPLYYWAWDQAPEDIDGHGVGDLWFVARP